MAEKDLMLGILAIYIIGITVFGIYVGRRVKTSGEFLMAGRGVNKIFVAGSTLATILGTGATIGAAGFAYQHGFAGSLYGIGQGIGIIIVGLAFAKMRRYNFMTLGEEITCYYGGNKFIYQFSNIAMFLTLVCWIGVQIMGAGIYLSILTNLSYQTAVISSGIAFGVLVVIGGFVSVVYTDVVQVIVFSIGFICLAVFGVIAVGGFMEMKHTIPEESWSFLGYKSVGWGSVFAIPLALAISYIAEPAYRHRIYSAKSEAHARWGMLVPGLLMIPFAILVSFVGMSCYMLDPKLTNPDEALPWLAATIFPTWAMALVVVTGFAATFSSANSDASCGSVFFIRHIYALFSKLFFGTKEQRYPKNSLLVSRLTVLVIMIIATVLTLQFKSIVSFIILFISVLGSGMATLIILGRFWRRATWQGAAGALIAGAVISIAVESIPALKEFWGEPIIPAALGAIIVQVVISLVTYKGKPSFDEVAKQMTQERSGLESEDQK
jgi:SSS family solute:Na+ symporter